MNSILICTRPLLEESIKTCHDDMSVSFPLQRDQIRNPVGINYVTDLST